MFYGCKKNKQQQYMKYFPQKQARFVDFLFSALHAKMWSIIKVLMG
jgi:hypothetical protein